MDWLTVLKAIAPVAPALLGIVGGFIPIPGASIALQALGTGIANALGVPATPEAVAAAAANAKDLELAKINAAVEEQKAKWAAGTEQERIWAHAMEVGITETNLTMREEMKVESQRHWFFTAWRPTAGWLFNFSALVFLILLVYSAIKALNGDLEAITVAERIWPSFLALLGPLALMVGVNVWARTADKAAGTETSSLKPKTVTTVTTTPVVAKSNPKPPQAVPKSRLPTYDSEGRLIN